MFSIILVIGASEGSLYIHVVFNIAILSVCMSWTSTQYLLLGLVILYQLERELL